MIEHGHVPTLWHVCLIIIPAHPGQEQEPTWTWQIIIWGDKLRDKEEIWYVVITDKRYNINQEI
jgi:hypothetical protein